MKTGLFEIGAIAVLVYLGYRTVKAGFPMRVIPSQAAQRKRRK